MEYNTENLMQQRVSWLYQWGHCTSGYYLGNKPTDLGHVVEIRHPYYVSKPCWKRINEAADLIGTIEFDFPNLLNADEFLARSEPVKRENVTQFFFKDIEVAHAMGLMVQKSARNKRKDVSRSLRLVEAGGFHNKAVLERIFEIQEGRCYFSGDPLIIAPKNYVTDHIEPIYLGGTDWPNNLALILNFINLWKEGLMTANETLNWIAEERGREWLKAQKAFCKQVDFKREMLHREFMQQHA